MFCLYARTLNNVNRLSIMYDARYTTVRLVKGLSCAFNSLEGFDKTMNDFGLILSKLFLLCCRLEGEAKMERY